MKYLIALLLLISGCGFSARDAMPMDYMCSQSEMIIVEKQTDYCRMNAGYIPSSCYVQAMDRNCLKKQESK